MNSGFSDLKRKSGNLRPPIFTRFTYYYEKGDRKRVQVGWLSVPDDDSS
jgi:hypothetical protein